MANEIKYPSVPALNVYVTLRNGTNEFANLSGTPTFEAYDANHWSSYALPMTDDGTGLYQANMPAVGPQFITLVYYLRDGASPAVGDTNAGADTLYWDGTILAASVPASVTGLATNDAGQVQVDPTQAIPLTNIANSLADCLNAARGGGFGPKRMLGNLLVIYGPDGITPIHQAIVDSPTQPTQVI